MDFLSIVEFIYNSCHTFSNVMTIVIPTLILWFVLISLYLRYKGIVSLSELENKKDKKPKLSEFLVLVILASFIGIITML